MALVPASAPPPLPIAEVAMADPASTVVRATVVQAATVFYDTPATLDKAERLMAEAAELGSQLVVFPEAFVGGYPRGSDFGVTIGSRSAKGKEDFRKYHASAIDVPGPEVDRLAAMAGKYKIFLVMGVIERAGYTLYCTVLFFDPQGQYLGKHRKLMPTALERVIWGFGDGSTIPVYETLFGKVGALICWENRMPLLRTALYGKDMVMTKVQARTCETPNHEFRGLYLSRVNASTSSLAHVGGFLLWDVSPSPLLLLNHPLRMMESFLVGRATVSVPFGSSKLVLFL